MPYGANQPKSLTHSGLRSIGPRRRVFKGVSGGQVSKALGFPGLGLQPAVQCCGLYGSRGI